MTFGAWAMFKEVLSYCLRERRMLLRYGAIPFAVITAAVLATPRPSDPTDLTQLNGLGLGLAAAIELLVCVPMVVTWYRMVVLGKDEAARRPLFTFGRREWRLLGWQLAVAVVTLAVLAAGGGIVVAVYYAMGQGLAAILLCVLLGTAGILAALAVLNRISFVFALAATDQPVSFKTSWQLTRGLTWPLLWTLMLIAGAQSLVTSLANTIGGLPGAIIQAAAVVFAFAAMATLFGLVYLRVQGSRDAAGEPA